MRKIGFVNTLFNVFLIGGIALAIFFFKWNTLEVVLIGSLIKAFSFFFFNYFRPVKCDKCGHINSIYRRDKDKLTCRKCSHIIEVELLTVDWESTVP